MITEIKNKMSPYKDRIKTGVALLALVAIIGVFHSFFIVWLFFGLIYLVALYEAMKLFGVSSNTIMAYAILLWIIAGFYPHPEGLFFLSFILFSSLVAYKQDIDMKFFFPFIYPTIGFLFLLTLYNHHAIDGLMWLLVIVVSADVGAFIVGKNIGKTQFSPTSPNKTLEGVMGGIIIATSLGTIVGLEMVGGFNALVISFFTAVASVFGDLFESYLKRQAGVKDSGNILPGHGGFLDRVDGYLFSSVVLSVLLAGLTP